jgi:NAD-dependent deacetylase sirtuin 2
MNCRPCPVQGYGLPYAEAIFDLDFFRSNPQPFYRLCKELWPGHYKPTPAHVFIRLLEKKGVLLRCYTQNIDSLESAAGLPSDRCGPTLPPNMPQAEERLVLVPF